MNNNGGVRGRLQAGHMEKRAVVTISPLFCRFFCVFPAYARLFWLNPVFSALNLSILRMFQTAPEQKGFRRFIARSLGFALYHAFEMLFEHLHDLGEAAAVEGLHNERTIGGQMLQGKLHGQLTDMLDASRIGRTDTGQIGRHVGHDQIDLMFAHLRLEGFQDIIVAKIALHELDACNGFHGQQVQRNDAPLQHSALSGQPFARYLRPTAGCRAQVDYNIAFTHQFFRIQDFYQLERCPGPIALLLGHLHVWIIDMLMYPFFREFLFGHCPDYLMPTLELTSKERSELRAAAHPLKPVVLIGDQGLTQAVLKEIDMNLTAHGLLKVRVAGDDRAARIGMLETICDELSCAAVGHVGKTLILYRHGSQNRRWEQKAEEPVERSRRLPNEPHTPKKLLAAGKTLKDRKSARRTAKGNDELAGNALRKPARSPASRTGADRSGTAGNAGSARAAHGIPRRSGSALSLRAGRRVTAGARTGRRGGK